MPDDWSTVETGDTVPDRPRTPLTTTTTRPTTTTTTKSNKKYPWQRTRAEIKKMSDEELAKWERELSRVAVPKSGMGNVTMRDAKTAAVQLLDEERTVRKVAASRATTTTATTAPKPATTTTTTPRQTQLGGRLEDAESAMFGPSAKPAPPLPPRPAPPGGFSTQSRDAGPVPPPVTLEAAVNAVPPPVSLGGALKAHERSLPYKPGDTGTTTETRVDPNTGEEYEVEVPYYPKTPEQLRNLAESGNLSLYDTKGNINQDISGFILGGRRPGAGRGLTALQGMSVVQAMRYLRGITSEQLIELQVDLVNAGMFGIGDAATAPILGVVTDETVTAFSEFLRRVIARPDQSVEQVLHEHFNVAAQWRSRMGQEDIAQRAAEKAKAMEAVTVPDSEWIDQTVDDVAQELLGQYLPDDVKQRIIGTIQSRSRERQENAIGMKYAAVDAAATPGSDAQYDDVPGLDSFMSALIGQESGGDPNVYNQSGSGAFGLGQIMPDNIVPWWTEAGIDPRDQSEAAQRRVIKHKLAQYYRQTGSWRDVAIMWYAGPKAPDRIRAGQQSGTSAQFGGPPIFQYADEVIGRMDTSGVSPTAVNGGSYETYIIEDFNSQAQVRSEVKRADPAGYEASKYKGQAINFLKLIGGIQSGV